MIGQSGCQSGNFRQLTYKIISALVDNCNSQGLVLNAGIGAIVQDLWDLNRSYESAVHALDYRFFFPHQNVFDGREALGHDLSATDFSDSREEALIRLLCKKDVSAIDSWFQDFSRWLTENFRTKSFAFIQIYSLLGRILKFFYELNLDTHDLEAKILYVYNHLEEFLLSEGCEPIVPALMEFVMYCLAGSVADGKLYQFKSQKTLFSKIGYSFILKVQKTVIKTINEHGVFEAPHDFDHIRKLADKYISQGVNMGEGWLIPAEMAALAETGTENIICTQPFGCLPNHIVAKGMSRVIKQAYPNANIVAIDYDPGATKVNQENRIKLMLANAKK